MSWLLWMVILFVIFVSIVDGKDKEKIRLRAKNSVPEEDFLRLEADLERMRRRMDTVERILTDDDEHLRRAFRNL